MARAGDIASRVGDSRRNPLENIGISRRAIDWYWERAQSVTSRNDDLVENRRERRKVDLRKSEETSTGQGYGVISEGSLGPAGTTPEPGVVRPWVTESVYPWARAPRSADGFGRTGYSGLRRVRGRVSVT